MDGFNALKQYLYNIRRFGGIWNENLGLAKGATGVRHNVGLKIRKENTSRKRIWETRLDGITNLWT
jgi:hypothetical protein